MTVNLGQISAIAADRGVADWLFDGAGLIAGFAAVVGVAFVAAQLRDVKHQLVAANLDPTAQRMLDADLALVTQPRLRKYIYGDSDGRPVVVDPQTDDGAAALSLAEYFLDLLDTEMLRRQQLPIVADRLPDFEPWLCDLLISSDAACRIISTNGAWYTEELLARFDDLARQGMLAWHPAQRTSAWQREHLLSDRWKAIVSERRPVVGTPPEASGTS